MTSVNVLQCHAFLSAAMCDHEGMKAADDNNMCWYYECIHNTHGLEWIPRRCAWMSKVSPNFVTGMFNPCTVNLMDGMYLSEFCSNITIMLSMIIHSIKKCYKYILCNLILFVNLRFYNETTT